MGPSRTIFGLAVLAGEITKYGNGLGLDPYYGFFHTTHNTFRALVNDLIEPFRWLVEYAVYKTASNIKNHQHPIRKDEHTWTRESRIILDEGLVRRFLELLERKSQSERPFEFKHGLRRRDGSSMCQEITIAKMQSAIWQNTANVLISRRLLASGSNLGSSRM